MAGRDTTGLARTDDWTVRTIERRRWYRHELEKDVDCAGIRCNIWERAKKRSLLTYLLEGGGKHILGYYAVPWESILHGKSEDCWEYKVLSVPSDKLGKYLFEYHSDSYTSPSLPALPAVSARRQEPNRRGWVIQTLPGVLCLWNALHT